MLTNYPPQKKENRFNFHENVKPSLVFLISSGVSPKAQTHQALQQPSWSRYDDHQLLYQLGNKGNLGALGSLVGLWRAAHHIVS